MPLERAKRILDPETSLEAYVECEYYGGFRASEHWKQEVDEACKIAVEAIEKQIPKKPTPHKVDVDKLKIGNANFGKGTTVYACSACKQFTSRVYNHCSNCGQALDWRDTK